MIAYLKKLLPSVALLPFVALVSCKKDFSDDNYVAYFGGEVINPKNNFVILLKDDVVIDTIFLNAENRFFKKFDSLIPGMYTFKHEPEYQYIYFDKNDSIMLRVNTRDFDESISFCGRGDEKNNFLVELFLKDESEKNVTFDYFELKPTSFIRKIDSMQKSKEDFYHKRKIVVEWGEDFDLFAKSSLDFSHYTRKEIYPVVHKIRTGVDVSDSLPKDYYKYRNIIDYNNEKLVAYSPFVRYLRQMMNNVTFYQFPSSSKNGVLEANIYKLNVADTLFKVNSVRDKMLRYIAHSYLLEDQNPSNNLAFFRRLNELVKDKKEIEEVNKIVKAVQNLKSGNELPEIMFVTPEGKSVNCKSVINNKSVVFFWTERAQSHLKSAYKKASEFQELKPNIRFIAINIDDNQDKWIESLQSNSQNIITEMRVENFEELKEKWAITKLQRTIVTNHDGTIQNAFANLFDAEFKKELE
ncbi:MAG: thioredoxin-like domain-containing protein [Flavobacteriaceae bacterium]|jgi:hypothetical protein|nr:thioredoxin-like domain-containing protein [Flavobacteriaceae bacterium]